MNKYSLFMVLCLLASKISASDINFSLEIPEDERQAFLDDFHAAENARKTIFGQSKLTYAQYLAAVAGELQTEQGDIIHVVHNKLFYSIDFDRFEKILDLYHNDGYDLVGAVLNTNGRTKLIFANPCLEYVHAIHHIRFFGQLVNGYSYGYFAGPVADGFAQLFTLLMHSQAVDENAYLIAINIHDPGLLSSPLVNEAFFRESMKANIEKMLEDTF